MGATASNIARTASCFENTDLAEVAAKLPLRNEREQAKLVFVERSKVEIAGG